MRSNTVAARLQGLWLLQVLGLVGVLRVSQQDWVKYGPEELTGFSPGASGTEPGLIVLGACVVALLWVGWFWQLGVTSTKVPFAAGVAVFAVVVHQLLTVPGSQEVVGRTNSIAPAVWVMAGGALVVVAATFALSAVSQPGRELAARESAARQLFYTLVGLLVFSIGAVLPWRSSGSSFVSVTENEVWLGSPIGFAAVLTVVFAFAVAVVSLMRGSLVVGPLQVAALILLTICGWTFVDLYPHQAVSAGVGLWIMATGSTIIGLSLIPVRRVSN